LISPLENGSLKPCREKKKGTDRLKASDYYYKPDKVSRKARLCDEKWVTSISQDGEQPQSAAAKVEGLACARRSSRGPRIAGGEDV